MSEVLTITTPPAAEPVTLDDVKTHCRVSYTDDDAYLSALIGAARRVVEGRLKMTIVETQYALSLDYFPNRVIMSPNNSVAWDFLLNARIYPYVTPQIIRLPNPPLVTVDSVSYIDTNGGTVTMDPSAYIVQAGTPGRLTPAVGASWPATQDRVGAVTITYTAGFSDDGTGTPDNIVAAIKLLVGHWYRNRLAVADGGAELPLGVDYLLDASTWGHYC